MVGGRGGGGSGGGTGGKGGPGGGGRGGGQRQTFPPGKPFCRVFNLSQVRHRGSSSQLDSYEGGDSCGPLNRDST